MQRKKTTRLIQKILKGGIPTSPTCELCRYPNELCRHPTENIFYDIPLVVVRSSHEERKEAPRILMW